MGLYNGNCKNRDHKPNARKQNPNEFHVRVSMPIANPIETGTCNTNEKKTKQRKIILNIFFSLLKAEQKAQGHESFYCSFIDCHDQ
jgi:hypothetical protein